MQALLNLRLLFGLLIVVAVLLAANLWRSDFALRSDLLALLPASGENEIAREAASRLQEALANDFVFLIGGQETDPVQSIANSLSQDLARADHLQPVDSTHEVAAHIAHMEELLPHRHHLLSRRQATALRTGGGKEILKQAIGAAFDPASLGGPASLTEDPLGIFNTYVLSFSSDAAAFEELENNIPAVRADGKVWAIVRGRAQPGAFNLEAQQALSRLERDLETALADSGLDLELLRAGGIFHAARAAGDARREVALIGVGSTLAILALFLLSFRSIRPLLLSALSIAFGCGCALVITGSLFGGLHLISLVFGASLIGVAVDYSLHSFCREQGTSRVVPGLAMAVTTSALGYASLMQARLPGLTEMAVFCTTGLLATGLFVAVILPLFNYRPAVKPARAISALSVLPSRLWQGRRRNLCWLLVPFLFAGLLQSNVESDLRVLHTPDPQLLAEQRRIASLVPGWTPNQFLLVNGADAEQMLRNAESLAPHLQRLVADGVIGEFSLLSDYLPSTQRQGDNLRLLRDTVYGPDAEVDRFFSTLGFAQQAQREFRETLNASRTLKPDDWLSTAPMEQRLLWLGDHNGRSYSLVLLRNIQDTQQLQALEHYRGVQFIDTVAELSGALSARTRSAALLLALAYGAIGVLLLVRYRKINALGLLLVPMAASAGSLALLSATGSAITLFHVFALYLILGLGMDYGIFLRESGRESTACLLAILLSALTTTISFGLLALSSTPMISAFGITVALGGIFNWLLVPLTVRE